MKKTLIYKLLTLVLFAAIFNGCKKTEYKFGTLKTPTNLTVTTAIQGSDSNPTGDGSGTVNVTATANNALTYKIYFGNGDSVLTSTGKATYKYTKLDTNSYTVTVNAIGTGGATSTLSKQIRVLYQYQIPANILSLLTNGSSKTWAIAKDTVGHFGVGPASSFSADWYKAQPNEKPACAYAGTIVFTQSGANSVTMIDNNQGSSFLLGGATAFYGTSGADGCYTLNAGGTKVLGFSAASSGSNATNSTGVKFSVPGNGIVNFGTGGTSYEILSLTAKVMVLRTIGTDGNAWYQIFRAQ